MSINTYARYCYVCASLLADSLEREPQTRANRHLCGQDAELHPVTCDAPICVDSYATLPGTRYREERVVLRSGVAYDGGPFQGLPQRVDRHMGDEVDLTNHRTIVPDYIPDRVSRLESLLQAWLFFGLLHEMLGPYFNENDYLDADENGDTVLLLSPLVDAISRMLSATSQNLSGPDDESMLSRVDNALGIVFEELAATVDSKFDEVLRCFLASAAEIVDHTMVYMYGQKYRARGFAIFSSSGYVRRLMDIGWCPHSARKARTGGIHLATESLYYQIDRRNHGPGHDLCSEAGCVQTRAAEGMPAYSHRSTCRGKDCLQVRLSDEQVNQVCAILEQNSFPLLQISMDGTGSISIGVVAYDKTTRYVAISHVWAQGLGNEIDNSLSACHLRYLYDRVRTLRGVLDPDKDKQPVLFWLDTFCCPVASRADTQFRKYAILKMRESYMAAACVLVIETELERYSLLDYSVVDLAARIFTSTWIQRLWTLQEGSLPEELWFQLNDGAVNAHSLFLALRDVHARYDVRDRLATRVIIRDFHQLRLASGRYQFVSRAQEFQLLLSGAARREVMHQKDEAVCIATLLKFDLAEIVELQEHQGRMSAFWDQASALQILPRSMAFSTGEKLDLPGFRWAYSTFLQPTVPGDFQTSTTLTGVATNRGLLIKAAGTSLEMAIPLRGFDIAQFGIPVPPLFQEIAVKQSNGWRRFSILDVSPYGRQDDPSPHAPISNQLRTNLLTSNKKFALVKQYHPSDSGSANDGTHLLVEMTGHDGPRTLCRRLCKGMLMEFPDHQRASITLACIQAEAMKEQQMAIIQAIEALDEPRSINETEAERRLLAKGVHERLLPHLSFDQSLIDGRPDIPDDVKVLGPDAAFPLRTALIFAGRYAVSLVEFPASQEWCID